MAEKIDYKTFLQFAKKKNAALFTYIYHPISYPFSFILFKLGFSANAVSIFGILLSILGGVLISNGKLLPGLIIFLLSYILDFCDGNIARIYRDYLKITNPEKQKLGLLLENLYANVSYFFFFISLGYYFYLQTGNINFLLFAVFTYGIKIISRYTSLHVCIVNKEEVRSIEGSEGKIFKSSAANKIKFFFTRLVDNARLYYISFILAYLIIPNQLASFFLAYAGVVLIINAIKINLTLIRKLP